MTIKTIPLLSLLVLLALLLSACDNGVPPELQGYIEGDYLYISPPVGGTLTNVPAAKGTRVSQDALLFELDPNPELTVYQEAQTQLQAARALYADKTKGQRSSELAAIEAAIDHAESSLAFSRQEYERLQKLHDQQVIATDKLDQAEKAYAMDRAAVTELRAKLETASMGARVDQREAARLEVRRMQAVLDRAQWAVQKKKGFAPTAALVVDVLYAPGEYVPAGYPVIVLLPPQNLKVRFFVTERRLSSVRTGQKISISIDGLARTLEGTISFIASEAEYTPPIIYSKDNREKLVFLVEAVVDAEHDTVKDLHPGQPVEVLLLP